MEYFKFKDGENRLRIISDPEHMVVHWVYHYPGQSAIGRMENCIGPTCHFCSGGLKVINRYKTNVIDRGDKQCKVALFGTQIYNQMYSLMKNPDWGNGDWGFLQKSDVRIFRENLSPHLVGGGPKKYHIFMDLWEIPLSSSEIDDVNKFLNRDDTIQKQSAKNPDVCKKCNCIGEVTGMACICRSCGNVIWGC